MSKINVLSFEVANLIAAGEVVDRPASAIKEMIENSIDAGARHITVEIKNGGITFMRISDDGCGMEPEDLPLAIKRHATSKIRDAEDLDGICTLGFRGEALAAIAAVSELRIISKTKDADMGTALTASCGEVVDLCEHGCSTGTTIIAEELFANVPARRKFLKRDATETTAVSANVERIAVSHPEIAFKLIADGQVKLETAGDGHLKSAIYAVFGRDYANRIIEVNSEYDGITVTGYIGRSDNVKGNRNYENFYINKRYIKSRTASAAIEQAYSSYMPSERFPVCVLFISLNPARVDVNVHPAKLEVKFSNEKPVFEAIYYAVKQALEQNVTRPEMRTSSVRMSQAFAPVEREASLKARQIAIDTPVPVKTEHKAAEPTLAQKSRVTADEYRAMIGIPPRAERVATPEKPKEASAFESKKADLPPIISPEQYVREFMCKNDGEKAKYDELVKKHLETESAIEAPIPAKDLEKPNEQVEVKAAIKPHYRIIGEAFNSYIIVEVGEKLIMIDKHAAHERIIFEQLKKNLYSGKVTSQMLMLPIEIMLMSDEVSAIEEYRGELEAVGFEFATSRNTVEVSAIPQGIEQDAVSDMFMTVADRVKNGTGNVNITKNILFEKALYQASCKAAIKAGREYPPEYQKWVVDKLMEIPDITFCPHGRPVAMEMTKKNMDHQFERT
ncbi:MAG: DNA mismatch repair endonuclease MutL [Clostridia bacterium]|nr:DNA mismatch repair endonuclease MutL [Clostridia bacterium]